MLNPRWPIPRISDLQRLHCSRDLLTRLVDCSEVCNFLCLLQVIVIIVNFKLTLEKQIEARQHKSKVSTLPSEIKCQFEQQKARPTEAMYTKRTQTSQIDLQLKNRRQKDQMRAKKQQFNEIQFQNTPQSARQILAIQRPAKRFLCYQVSTSEQTRPANLVTQIKIWREVCINSKIRQCSLRLKGNVQLRKNRNNHL